MLIGSNKYLILRNNISISMTAKSSILVNSMIAELGTGIFIYKVISADFYSYGGL